MEFGIFVLIVLIVVGVGFAISLTARSRFKEFLARIASQRPGVTLEEGMFSLRLLYRRREWSAEVSFHRGGDNSPDYTRFEAAMRRPRGRLHVKRQGFFAGLKKLFGAEDIEIGSASFDERFVVSASPTSFAREFLTDEVRRKIEVLRGIDEDFVLDMHGRRLHLQVGAYLDDEGRLVRFLDHCEGILEAACGKEKEPIDSRGIDFIRVDEPGGGECQICGHEMREEVVTCRKCRTRHHKPCWEYYGSCSTFGCGEKKNVPA